MLEIYACLLFFLFDICTLAFFNKRKLRQINFWLSSISLMECQSLNAFLSSESSWKKTTWMAYAAISWCFLLLVLRIYWQFCFMSNALESWLIWFHLVAMVPHPWAALKDDDSSWIWIPILNPKMASDESNEVLKNTFRHSNIQIFDKEQYFVNVTNRP